MAACIAVLLGIVGYVGGGRSAPQMNGSVYGWLFFFGTYGIPVSLVVGWWLGPRATRPSPGATLRLGARAALASIVVGALEVSLVSGLRDALTHAQPLGAVMMMVLMLPMIGIMWVGLPAFVVLLPVTIAWAFLMGVLRPHLEPARGRSAP
jgi:hypothetical protein